MRYTGSMSKHAAEELTEEVSLRIIEESLIFESWGILQPGSISGSTGTVLLHPAVD